MLIEDHIHGGWHIALAFFRPKGITV